MADLNYYIKNINDIFKNERNRYKAHELCKPLLLEMAKDQSILFEIIKQNLQKPDFFQQKRINPVIALDIAINETISFVAHCWMPLPDKRNDITHQSIHHHGKLLLTSVAAFGPGYESIIFKKGFSIDKISGLTNMKIDKIYTNPYLNIEFIDVNTPHIVFYPSEFSITYALWTNVEEARSENMKKIGFVNKYKKQLRKAIDFFGAAKLFGLNTIEYLDFYPNENKIIAMKSRVMYPAGSNESFLYGLFSFLQTVKYNDTVALKNVLCKTSESNKGLAQRLFEKFNSNEPINDVFEKEHLNIPKINFEKAVLLKCF
jgi:hypothetical protein